MCRRPRTRSARSWRRRRRRRPRERDGQRQGHPRAALRVRQPAPTRGSLKVVTTNLRPGYLRKNGVPYSERAVVTEYYDRFAMFGNDYLQVVTVVADPAYLTTPFVVSNQFKREL